MDRSKIKICIISGDFPPTKGGLADYTKYLFDKLEEILGRNNVFLITTSSNFCEFSVKNKNILNIIDRWNFGGVVKIVKVIKKLNPDIVHIQYPTDNYGYNPGINFLPFFLRFLGLNLSIVSTIHEFDNRSMLGKIRLSINILFSTKTIIVSQAYEKSILNFLFLFKFLLKNKIKYIPVGSNVLVDVNAISKKEIDRIRKKLGVNKKDIILCNFGIVRSGKGIEFLIETFNELIKEGHNNLKLLFIGECKDNFYQQFKKIIEVYELKNYIYLTGYCSSLEASKYLLLSDICVLPFEDGITAKRGSFFAPFFYGIPIITTKSKFVPEGLIDHKNVILITYGSKEELKRYILELINDNTLRKRMSQNIKKALYYFSWDTIALQTISLYKQIRRKNE